METKARLVLKNKNAALDLPANAGRDHTLPRSGLSAWAGPSLSTALLGDTTPYRDVLGRGLNELGAFLKAEGVT